MEGSVMLPVRIIVRTATPWERMTAADFYSQSHWLLPAMAVAETKRARVVHLWEEAYQRSYCQYRAMVRDECMLWHQECWPDAISVGIEKVDWFDSDEILLPIDDDDTYDLDVVQAVRAAMVPGINLVRWPRRLSLHGDEKPEHVFRTTYLDTCNWAIRKSFLTEWGIEKACILLAWHWVAHGMVRNRLCPKPLPRDIWGLLAAKRAPPEVSNPLIHPSIAELKEPHSTYYVHSGSISFLDGSKRKKQTEAELVRYLRTLPLHPCLN